MIISEIIITGLMGLLYSIVIAAEWICKALTGLVGRWPVESAVIASAVYVALYVMLNDNVDENCHFVRRKKRDRLADYTVE